MDPIKNKSTREVKLENAFKELLSVLNVRRFFDDVRLSPETRKTIASLEQEDLVTSAMDKLTLAELGALGFIEGWPVLNVRTNLIDALKDEFVKRFKVAETYISGTCTYFFSYESGHDGRYDSLWVPVTDSQTASVDIIIDTRESLGTKWSKYRCMYKYNFTR